MAINADDQKRINMLGRFLFRHPNVEDTGFWHPNKIRVRNCNFSAICETDEKPPEGSVPQSLPNLLQHIGMLPLLFPKDK